jgi:hypothetical protein
MTPGGRLVVELNTVAKLEPVHFAQVMTSQTFGLRSRIAYQTATWRARWTESVGLSEVRGMRLPALGFLGVLGD